MSVFVTLTETIGGAVEVVAFGLVAGYGISRFYRFGKRKGFFQ